MTSIPPPDDLPGWPERWEPARLVPLDGGRLGLALHAGAWGRDLAGVARLISDACYVDHARSEPGGTSVVLIFQEPAPSGSAALRPGPSGWTPAASADAATIPGELGWVPKVGAATGPDQGITPHQLAVWELLTAAPDGASGARLVDAVMHRLPPETVVVLADLLRDRRGDRCSCRT
jgi:hypothetical protein